MFTSETDIANSALAEIGARRITSLSDDSDSVRVCKEQFNNIRDSLLESHPWNFAIKRLQLGKLATSPEFGFDNQFQLPSDCLRVLGTTGS